MRRPIPLTEEQLEMFPWMPEATREADASLNETVDLFEYILKEYDEKGYALGVFYLYAIKKVSHYVYAMKKFVDTEA
jgi:hypothetical protein